ncbi:VRR-NUC domain-containing protein [Bradyrhizobium sp. AUGA SZCCT0182]|uniref:VRR-NUC domain-containing protein n=1 Tax=Bradyrhizobium sp. AUGA SZCCT0182 TaxID=2807667 RepID=UPI001BA52310|nr:VRR-NUC domain-containing protein [Bradyrhizobium sp. AUGA SZCCT0182]MBR1237871.1 VRR-NUC domain-containing protein [Bradyrhizobium sp. AUGA SZCCT0182]
MTAARQLHLFKSRRQRGQAPPAASEYQLHCAVADTVKRWIMPGWIFTHIASGEKRDQVTAARLKRMGVTAGFPDLVFFGPQGQVCFVELKSRRGRLGEHQADIVSHLVAAGHGYLCSSDYRDVVETLKAWGVLKSGIHVQWGTVVGCSFQRGW